MIVEEKSNTGMKIDGNWFNLTEKIKQYAETIEEGSEVEIKSTKNEKSKYLDLTFIKLIKKPDINFKSAKEIPERQNDKDKYWQDRLDFDRKKQELITKEALFNTAVAILGTTPLNANTDYQTTETIKIAKKLYQELAKDW